MLFMYVYIMTQDDQAHMCFEKNTAIFFFTSKKIPHLALCDFFPDNYVFWL